MFLVFSVLLLISVVKSQEKQRIPFPVRMTLKEHRNWEDKLDKEISELQYRLEILRIRYNDEYSEVKKLRSEIEIVKKVRDSLKLYKSVSPDTKIPGKRPGVLGNYKKLIVQNINKTFNDPYSVRFVEWKKPEVFSFNNEMYWRIRVILRAKNQFNAYVLETRGYIIKNNKITYLDINDLLLYFTPDK